MSEKLAGKSVVVTGASRGIGSAIAMLFAQNGANVIINYNKNKPAAQELAMKINSMYPDISKDTKSFPAAACIQADVSKSSDAKKLIQSCIDIYGRIDILINNAGKSEFSVFTDINEQSWDEMIAVNLKSVYNCCQPAIANMLNYKNGKIINISSIWGLVGASCEVHYSAAKGAVIAMTKALAKELGPSNIHVNAIAPGVIRTDMLSNLNSDDMAALVEETPLMRLGTAEDIARCALYLASSDSDYVTGQVISPNGGFVI